MTLVRVCCVAALMLTGASLAKSPAELVFRAGQQWLVQGQVPGMKAVSSTLRIGTRVDRGPLNIAIFPDPTLSKRNPPDGFVSFAGNNQGVGSLIAQFPTFDQRGALLTYETCTVRGAVMNAGAKRFEGKLNSFNAKTFALTEGGTCRITLK